jgi:hypothetical protein
MTNTLLFPAARRGSLRCSWLLCVLAAACGNKSSTPAAAGSGSSAAVPAPRVIGANAVYHQDDVTKLFIVPSDDVKLDGPAFLQIAAQPDDDEFYYKLDLYAAGSTANCETDIGPGDVLPGGKLAVELESEKLGKPETLKSFEGKFSLYAPPRHAKDAQWSTTGVSEHAIVTFTHLGKDGATGTIATAGKDFTVSGSFTATVCGWPEPPPAAVAAEGTN